MTFDTPENKPKLMSKACVLGDLERETILKAIYVYKGNRSLAARALGVSRKTLYARLKSYQKAGFKILKAKRGGHY